MVTKEKEIYVYGVHPVEELLVKAEKLHLVKEVFITKERLESSLFMGILQKTKVSFKKVTEDEIESRVGRGVVHQGVCVLVNSNGLYSDLPTFLQNHSSAECLILLDELEDPHNVGAIIRSALAFGASGVLIPTHGQVQVNGTVAKTSAGAIFSLPLIQIGNINSTLRILKDNGYWIYGLTGKGNTKLPATSFDSKTVFVIGSEGSGMREKTEDLCDFKLSIPISETCESLNASNAVAVVMYEWSRQRYTR